jgi:hypothetical protein
MADSPAHLWDGQSCLAGNLPNNNNMVGETEKRRRRGPSGWWKMFQWFKTGTVLECILGTWNAQVYPGLTSLRTPGHYLMYMHRYIYIHILWRCAVLGFYLFIVHIITLAIILSTSASPTCQNNTIQTVEQVYIEYNTPNKIVQPNTTMPCNIGSENSAHKLYAVKWRSRPVPHHFSGCAHPH